MVPIVLRHVSRTLGGFRRGLPTGVSLPSSVLLAAWLSTAWLTGAAPAQTAVLPEVPRLLVLTDIGGDPDDQQSLIRLLLYANAFEIEGLIASASGTPGELPQALNRPDLIRQTLEAYALVQPNLSRHEPGYPPAALLLQRVKSGNPQRARAAVGEGQDTPGADWIIQCADRNDPRPLNIAIWGGQTDLAQALWRVRADRGASGLRTFINKIRVFDIADQDGIAAWMFKEFPGLFYVLSQAPDGMDRREAAFRGMYLGGDISTTSREWISANVRQAHGPLGALYPTRTWTAPNPHGALKEGDTPSWFFFLPQGLNLPDRPETGGWGGRYVPDQNGIYRDAPDVVEGARHVRHTVSRWRPDFQADFQARLDWCVNPPERANHRPVVVVNQSGGSAPLVVTAAPGQTVRFDASASSDPDGHRLHYRWWIYPEAGTIAGPVELQDARNAVTELRFPADLDAGELHLILEVQDNGDPALKSYRRIIVTVGESTASLPDPTPPTWPGRSWPIASPEQVGLDAALLRQARDYALTGQGSGMVVRHGFQVLAWGLYDSLIVVIPSLDLVVVRAGQSWKRQPPAHHCDVLAPFLKPIAQAVLAANSGASAEPHSS